jgi:tRNA pseudouridine55 synthase
VPPMVSALRVGGKRLHALAREGVEVDRAPRPVTVHRFEVAPTDDAAVVGIDVTCSSGTYVRSLAADLGTLLGGGAHLRALRRRAVGDFTEDEAAPPDTATLRPVATAVRHLRRVDVDADVAALVANGRVLPAFAGDGPWAVTSPGGDLLAVYERFRGDEAKPAVVLTPPAAGGAQPDLGG